MKFLFCILAVGNVTSRCYFVSLHCCDEGKKRSRVIKHESYIILKCCQIYKFFVVFDVVIKLPKNEQNAWKATLQRYSLCKNKNKKVRKQKMSKS